MQSRRFAPYAAILAVLAFQATRFDRFWIPLDEGVIAYPAERVLNGELPHRDFVAGYSGGFELLNAGAMRVLGTDLLAPRIALYAAFAVWLVVVLKIARAFAGPVEASVLVLLAGLASVPQYPAAMPSWYNLFLATFVVLGLLRYRATGRTRWLVAAGGAAGLSIAIKVVGLYAVAGALLTFGFWATEPATESRRGGPAWLTLALLTPFVVSVAYLIRSVLVSVDPIYLLLPALLLAAALVVRAARSGRTGPDIFVRWVSPALLFVAGTATILLVGALPYLTSGSLDALLFGIFGRAGIYLDTLGGMHFPGAGATLAGILAAGSLVAAVYAPTRWRWVWCAGVAIEVAALIVIGGRRSAADFMVITARPWVPVLATWFAISTWKVAPARAKETPNPSDTAAAALVCMTAMVSLVQYPFPFDGYIFYFAPLAVLSAGALLRSIPSMGAPAGPVAALLYGGWLVMNSINLVEDSTTKLDLPRGGLRVRAADAQAYERMVATVDSLTTEPFILTAPDIPEVYFLAGRRNPTRTLYDAFEKPEEHLAEVRDALAKHRVDVAVLGNGIQPIDIDPGLEAFLDSVFPVEVSVGPFTVRAKPDASGLNRLGSSAPPR